MDTTATPPPMTAVRTPVRRQVFVRGRVLVDGAFQESEVAVEDGRVVEVGAAVGSGRMVDARGLLLLPGIIDLHGDAFERALQPRQGVGFPAGLALGECDAWCLAAGITTPFISITDSFEPGLRSRDTLRGLLALIHGGQPLATDLRVHVRHEVCLVDGHAELVEWLERGRIHLLSTADHLPAPDQPAKLARYVASVARRSHLGQDEIGRLIAGAAAQRELGRRLEGELCALALRLGLPLASHDDASPAEVDASVARGCSICEFPATLATARHARTRGAAVLLGAPNYVRGGSHLGLMGVAEALQDGVVDALCSDYHFPSLFHAPFAMARRSQQSLAEAWELVSTRPALLADLPTKGRIAPGRDADLLLVEDRPVGPRLRGVWVAGREMARFG